MSSRGRCHLKLGDHLGLVDDDEHGHIAPQCFSSRFSNVKNPKQSISKGSAKAQQMLKKCNIKHNSGNTQQ